MLEGLPPDRVGMAGECCRVYAFLIGLEVTPDTGRGRARVRFGRIAPEVRSTDHGVPQVPGSTNGGQGASPKHRRPFDLGRRNPTLKCGQPAPPLLSTCMILAASVLTSSVSASPGGSARPAVLTVGALLICHRGEHPAQSGTASRWSCWGSGRGFSSAGEEGGVLVPQDRPQVGGRRLPALGPDW